MTKRWGARAHDGLVAAERVLCAALAAALLVLLSAQVFWRYVLDSPLTWTDELARFALVWLTFIGAGLVQVADEHIAVRLLVTKVSRRAQIALSYLTNGVPLLLGVAWIYYGLEPVSRGMNTTATATGLPMAVVYSATLVGFALIVVHSARNLLRIHTTGQAMHDASPEDLTRSQFT